MLHGCPRGWRPTRRHHTALSGAEPCGLRRLQGLWTPRRWAVPYGKSMVHRRIGACCPRTLPCHRSRRQRLRASLWDNAGGMTWLGQRSWAQCHTAWYARSREVPCHGTPPDQVGTRRETPRSRCIGPCAAPAASRCVPVSGASHPCCGRPAPHTAHAPTAPYRYTLFEVWSPPSQRRRVGRASAWRSAAIRAASGASRVNSRSIPLGSRIYSERQ